MTHNLNRKGPIKEFFLTAGPGVLYGITSVSVGHPFDTIKTKMQAQRGFENISMIRSFVTVLRNQGIVGLYRGCIPPFCGSAVFRSLQFASFESAYTLQNNAFGVYQLPYTGGLQIRVLTSAVLAATVRSLIESPLDYIKVRRQTNQSWKLKNVYIGFQATYLRTIFLFLSFFTVVDSGRRHYPDQFSRPLLGPFLTAGLASTCSWWLVWPFETIKSQIQSDYGARQSIWKRVLFVIRKRGILGLYRGIGPGTLRSFLANGASFAAMSSAQKFLAKKGYRD